MNYDDMTNAPRYGEFLTIALDMTPQDNADFMCWCWVNSRVPNPVVLDKWLNAKIASKNRN